MQLVIVRMNEDFIYFTIYVKLISVIEKYYNFRKTSQIVMITNVIHVIGICNDYIFNVIVTSLVCMCVALSAN